MNRCHPATLTLHPLHLLDDLLASLSACGHSTDGNLCDNIQDQNEDEKESSPNHDDSTATTDATAAALALAHAEAKQDVVLKAASDLFANHISLLENSLALLDEQQQYQDSLPKENEGNFHEDNLAPVSAPVIRRIRAKRSGREAILIRKQRKKSRPGRKSRSSADNSNNSQLPMNNTTTDKKNDIVTKQHQHPMEEYYLCLLGRERFNNPSRRTLFSNNNHPTNGYQNRVYRTGAHCTCRSFFQNIKGGNNNRSSLSTKRSDNTETTNFVVSSKADTAVVCKHLLAAILMPHLLPWSNKPMEEEIVEDKEFAKLVMRASIG